MPKFIPKIVNFLCIRINSQKVQKPEPGPTQTFYSGQNDSSPTSYSAARADVLGVDLLESRRVGNRSFREQMFWELIFQRADVSGVDLSESRCFGS